MTVTRHSKTARSTGSSSRRFEIRNSHQRKFVMEAARKKDTVTTITTHYIDGAFVESHGKEVMDIIKPTNREVIGRVTLADEEDTRRAIAAAKRAFIDYGRSTKEERLKILRRMNEVTS